MAKDFPKTSKGFNPFGELIGLEFTSMGDGKSECALNIEVQLLNPHKVAHGAALYAMADTGMGGALYTRLAPGELCATSEITIAYFRAVPEGRLVCRTKVLHKGKRTAGLESEIFSGEDLVAKAMGTYAIFEKK